MSDSGIHPIGSSHGREIGRGNSSKVRVVRDPDIGKLTRYVAKFTPNTPSEDHLHMCWKEEETMQWQETSGLQQRLLHAVF
jgi:hypothetical protein